MKMAANEPQPLKVFIVAVEQKLNQPMIELSGKHVTSETRGHPTVYVVPRGPESMEMDQPPSWSRIYGASFELHSAWSTAEQPFNQMGSCLIDAGMTQFDKLPAGICSKKNSPKILMALGQARATRAHASSRFQRSCKPKRHAIANVGSCSVFEPGILS